MKASAGSGKTWNLAKKYISLLIESDDRYAYRHILAVTFTNKATDEMKNRILKELYVLASDPSSSDYTVFFVPSCFSSEVELQKKAAAVLHDILHDYSAFAVSTIDRFFQQTLKAFSREIGQFASYRVELDKDSLVAESVDRMLDSLTEEDSGLLGWLTDNVLEQIEQGGRYSMDANLLEMAKRLKSPQRQDIVEGSGLNEDEICSKENLMRIRERCRKIMDSFVDAVRSKAEEAVNIIVEAGVNPADSNRGFLKALYGYCELSHRDMVPLPTASFIAKASDPDQWFSKAKAKTMKPLVYPFLEAPLNDFCALFEKEYVVYNTSYILDRQLYGLGVAGELNRTFKELMKEKNVLCIDDSNTILRDIIDGSDAPFVYEKLGVRFEHFLLDEFQDTAKVQWQNFSPLLHNSDSQGGQNLIVGDVKQSIYRWRGSDWKLLNDIIPSEFEDHKETVLDTNWRSLSSIVDFNNGFFAAAAGVLDKIDGKKVCGPLSGIYADVNQEVAASDKPEGSVSLTFCDKENELQKVLDSVHEVCDAGAELSEVAVLVRSNAIGEAVASFLMDNGISVITDDSLKVKSSVTVRRLVSLMSYMENPKDTVGGYLAESLDVEPPQGCSSLVDMAENLLRKIKAVDKDGVWMGEVLHIQSFMDHVLEYVSSNGNSLRGFLRYWDDENPSISSHSSGNSVRVMTIHKSKGLDFPYVIIPFAESICLYKADNHWCIPELMGTELEAVGEGVYDVTLSQASETTLFAEDYRNEKFLQHVDNINTLYVAMTRAALGMHVIASKPSAKCLKALDDDDLTQFSDFSQMLYWYASSVYDGKVEKNICDDGAERYDIGEHVDFSSLRKSAETEWMDFDVAAGDEYPSIPLNPEPGDTACDVRERGRLKFSADSVDYFSDDEAGMSASKRIRGIVLHDILSRVVVPEDLDNAVADALSSGELTAYEVVEVSELLKIRISEVYERGWFSVKRECVLNEAGMIDTDGRILRPDRVVVCGGKVRIIDYKFGEHHPSYVRQLKKYADIWRRMGYQDVSASVWYVQKGEVVDVV